MTTDKITSFVIDRETWDRGGLRQTALLTDDNKRCCLGFYGEACGLSDSMQLNTADPGELDEASKKTLKDAGGEWLFMQDEYCHRQSKATNDLIFENDNSVAKEEAREQNIARIFADNGVTVTFIN